MQKPYRSRLNSPIIESLYRRFTADDPPQRPLPTGLKFGLTLFLLLGLICLTMPLAVVVSWVTGWEVPVWLVKAGFLLAMLLHLSMAFHRLQTARGRWFLVAAITVPCVLFGMYLFRFPLGETSGYFSIVLVSVFCLLFGFVPEERVPAVWSTWRIALYQVSSVVALGWLCIVMLQALLGLPQMADDTLLRPGGLLLLLLWLFGIISQRANTSTPKHIH
ncbi:MAG: hypothetical protein MUD01_18290 [Chloroflexaceae bacterium]|nr:hypothetical protein [Chloroflexaceae bacterium]